jgi:hypothetical protein
MFLLSFFADIATVVGFYSVSIPFFAVGHPLLAGCGKEERFRVSSSSFHRTFVLLQLWMGRNMFVHIHSCLLAHTFFFGQCAQKRKEFGVRLYLCFG